VNIIDGILSRKVFGGLKPHLEMEIHPPGAALFSLRRLAKDVLKARLKINNQLATPLFNFPSMTCYRSAWV
jgi:hypothetical protein